jgi:hypothetical protein
MRPTFRNTIEQSYKVILRGLQIKQMVAPNASDLCVQPNPDCYATLANTSSSRPHPCKVKPTLPTRVVSQIHIHIHVSITVSPLSRRDSRHRRSPPFRAIKYFRKLHRALRNSLNRSHKLSGLEIAETFMIRIIRQTSAEEVEHKRRASPRARQRPQCAFQTEILADVEHSVAQVGLDAEMDFTESLRCGVDGGEEI